jgi:hypothetical protein
LATVMGLRGRLRRLEREAQEDMVAIRQPDGSVERFLESELAQAFLDAFDRTVGRKGPDEPLHPLCVAAGNSSDRTWRGSFYASGGEGSTGPIRDLSE